MTEENSIPSPGAWPGRSSRLEYWLSVFAIVGIEAVFALVLHLAMFGQIVGFGIWLWVSARRLHDMNASAMWGWSLFLLGFAIGFGKAIAAPLLHTAVFEHTANLALALATVVLVAIIGSISGTNGENRFGSRTVPNDPRMQTTVADTFD
jgi:uncharacterized membrane protein YhaH (DUF805 family)